MKKLNPSIFMSLAFGICFFTLSACSTNTVEDNTDVNVKLDLKSTSEFIPVLNKSKEGLPVPYEAKQNPYTKQKGRINKESILGFIDAKRAINSNNLDKAESLLTNLGENEAKLSGPWVLLGDIAVEKSDLEHAISLYQKALAINAENVNAYLRLALTQRKLGRFIAAQNTYAQALSVWADFPEAHLNVAILYDLYLNHPIRAQKHMEAYLFLAKGEDNQATQWLDEIRSRTGISPSLPVVSEEIALYEKEKEKE